MVVLLALLGFSHEAAVKWLMGMRLHHPRWFFTHTLGTIRLWYAVFLHQSGQIYYRVAPSSKRQLTETWLLFSLVQSTKVSLPLYSVGQNQYIIKLFLWDLKKDFILGLESWLKHLSHIYKTIAVQIVSQWHFVNPWGKSRSGNKQILEIWRKISTYKGEIKPVLSIAYLGHISPNTK